MRIFKSARRAVLLFMLLLCGGYSLLIPTEIFPQWLDAAFKQYLYLDKVMHATLFFSVVTAMHWATYIRRRYLMAMAVIVGLGTELIQMSIEGRSGSVGDFLADASGALTAVWLTGVFSVFLTTKTRESLSNQDKIEPNNHHDKA